MKQLNKKKIYIYLKSTKKLVEDGIDTHGMPPIENGMAWERDPPDSRIARDPRGTISVDPARRATEHTV